MQAIKGLLNRKSAVRTQISAQQHVMSQLLSSGDRLHAVDVGGAGDLPPTWQRLRKAADFIVYEPEASSLAKLRERAQRDKAFENFNYVGDALVGSGGTRVLHVTNTPTGSSLLPPKKSPIGHPPNSDYFWPVTPIPVETKTLQQSLNEQNIERIDCVKLDTQGSEYEIIMGLDDKRWDSLLLVETEIAIVEVYEGAAGLLEKFVASMRERGFALFDMRTVRMLGSANSLGGTAVQDHFGEDPALPPNAWRLAEVDALFIREPDAIVASADIQTFRRYLTLLGAYYFYAEMFYTVRRAAERHLITPDEAEHLEKHLVELRKASVFSCKGARKSYKANNGHTWSQYLWNPYPSS